MELKQAVLIAGLTFCSVLGARANAWWELTTISTICSEEGVRIVETFAEEFLPNAYGRYEKARDEAKLLNQTFNEEFPEPVSKGADTYVVYEKVMSRLRAAAKEYGRQKDELAHLYFRHKAGAITSEELAKLDEAPLKIDVVEMYSLQKPLAIKELEGKRATFAAKFMPETFARYQLFVKEHAQSVRLYEELHEAREKTLAPFDQVFWAVSQKAERLGKEANALTASYNELYMSHRIGDVDAERLYDIDRKKASALKGFVQTIPTMVRECVENPIKDICDSMVMIPGRSFKMGRTEVTQAVWQRMMGNNPSSFTGPNLPVERVPWDDCQEFVAKLNAASGLKFRLPTLEEWEYCCRAGGTGDWGKRANGQEGPLDEMGWYYDNSSRNIHPVARKEPNAWGLYDMHGNVWEWTSTVDHGYRVRRGGSCNTASWFCTSGSRSGNFQEGRDYDLVGLRLVCEDSKLGKRQTDSEKPRTAENKSVQSQPVTDGQVWVPGAYVDQVQANGSVVRVWQPGHFETGNATQPVTPSPVRQQVVRPQPVSSGQGWVPGAYVDEVQANGSVIRVWKPGHFETGNATQPRSTNPVQFNFQQKLDKKLQRKLRKL